MSNDKGRDKNKFFEEMSTIDDQLRNIQKQKQKVMVKCSHQNGKGRLKIFPIGERGMFECKFCHQRFNMAPIGEEDLKTAINVLHDAIQQIRCYSDRDQDENLIRTLGELDFNTQTILELYARVIHNYGNDKKSKGKRDDREYGSYGSGSLSFLGGGRRK